MTTRSNSWETEFVHWLVLAILAVLLVFAVGSVLGAADPMSPPELLPAGIAAWAKPIPKEMPRPFFPELPPGQQLPTAQAVAQLWTILELHRQGNAVEALDAWDKLALCDAQRHWRQIAQGEAYLRMGDLAQAQRHLEAALQQAPGHAAARYFLGLVRLEQAAEAMRLPEGQRRVDRFVAYGPREDRRHFELLAIGDFEAAIAAAPALRPNDRLLTADEAMEESLVVPTAGDLMSALGADRLAGRAHHVLFGLELRELRLWNAEQHLRQAAQAELPVLYGYHDLMQAYAEQGQFAAAARVLWDGMRYGFQMGSVTL